MELGEERVGVKNVGVGSFFVTEMFVPEVNKEVIGRGIIWGEDGKVGVFFEDFITVEALVMVVITIIRKLPGFDVVLEVKLVDNFVDGFGAESPREFAG